MFRSVFGVFFASLFLISCKEDRDISKSASLPLRFEKEIIERKAGANCDTAEYDCSVINLEVVKARGAGKTSEEINEALEKHLILLLSSEENDTISSLEGLTENFIEDYKKAAEEFSEEPPWEAYITEKISLETPSLLSIKINTEIFSGGAHGYKSINFINFDPRTGKKYSSEELFEPGFTDFVEKKFRKEQGIPEDENINSSGFWFEDDTFSLSQNIGFTEDAVILVYNSYEIAPYAAGDFHMEIPMEEALPFLQIQ